MQQFYLRPVKTPTILQMQTVDCGVAALGIILAYYGCHLSLNDVHTECIVSREGVSIANLTKAAHHFGLDTQIYRDGLVPTLKLPAILFWNRKHYIVLEGIKGNKVYINDPKLGRQVINGEHFFKQFSGIVIQLQKNSHFKQCSKSRLWQNKLVPLLKEQRRPFAWWCAGMLLVSLLNLSPLFCTKLFVDKIIVHQQLHLKNWLFSWMAFFLMLQWMACYSTRWLFRCLETHVAVNLNKIIIHHLIHLPMRFFMYRRSGDLLARIQAVDRLVGPTWSALCLLCTSLIQASISFVLLAIYSPLLSLATLGTMIFYFLTRAYGERKWGHVAQAAKVRMRELTVLTGTYIATITQIKAQCSESIYLAKWQQALHSYLKAHQRVAYKHHAIHLLHFFTFSTGYLCVLIIGLYLVQQKQLTLGEIMACQILFLSFNEAFAQRAQLTNQVEHIESEVQNIDDILDYPMAVNVVSNRLHVTLPKPCQGRIQLVDLSFGYSREFSPILEHLNVIIKPGAQVVIRGASGSGKSSLVYLLAGLYEPWSGMILIDDVSLNEYSPAERAAFIGIVNQHQFFYQGSIKDNLCLWHSSTDEELYAALHMACIDELVTQCNHGLDFQLTEGATNISGGQRQRLELARTLLAQPKILILDEATNSLDPLIEKQIRTNLRHYPATKIIINHRIKTVDEMDEAFVLHKGQLISNKQNGQVVTYKEGVELIGGSY